MTEGLTDKMRCSKCRARWSLLSRRGPAGGGPHVWVVPVEAVTQAAAQIELTIAVDADDALWLDGYRAGAIAMQDAVLDLFSLSEEGQTDG